MASARAIQAARRKHFHHGLPGGVGKSRLAVEYAWCHQRDYIALLLLPGETPQMLRQGLADLDGNSDS